MEVTDSISWYEGLKEFFDIVEDDGKNVKVSCKKCLPQKTVLSTSKSSASNLLKHVKVCTRVLLSTTFGVSLFTRASSQI